MHMSVCASACMSVCLRLHMHLLMHHTHVSALALLLYLAVWHAFPDDP